MGWFPSLSCLYKGAPSIASPRIKQSRPSPVISPLKMGTAVLRSHPDPFLHIDSFGSRTPPPPMKPHRRKALRSAASPAVQSRLRRSPASLPAPASRAGAARSAGRRVTFADKENAAASMVERFPSHNIVMEKVKILKRGEGPADVRSREAASPSSPADRRYRGGDVSVLPVDRCSNDGDVSFLPVDRRSNVGVVSASPLPVVDRRSNSGAVSSSPPPGVGRRSNAGAVSSSPPPAVDRRSNAGTVSSSPPPAVDRAASASTASPLFSTTPLGPEPEILPKQNGFSAGVPSESDTSPFISKLMPRQNELSTPPQVVKNVGFSEFLTPVAYAGPGYINSPSPSSVPFPALFMSKSEAGQAVKWELATKNLRGLLRLGDSP